MRHLPNRKHKQRGVALVTALLVVSIATVAAVAMATRFQIDLRRTGNLLNGEQAYAYALSAESWAYVILRRDLIDSKYDTLNEDWATALPPIPVEGGFVEGRVLDLQGRFNINNLVSTNGSPNTVQLDYYKRLLDILGLDPALAPALLDWLDANIDATFPDGAEDDEYLLGDVPYRAANRPIVEVSELRLVKGYIPEVVAALEPHITALPVPTTININTANLIVLQALHADLKQEDVERLITDREATPFTDIKEFLAHDALAGLQLLVPTGLSSDWFSILTNVGIGRGRARLESILFRNQKNLQVVSRTRTAKRIPEDESEDDE